MTKPYQERDIFKTTGSPCSFPSLSNKLMKCAIMERILRVNINLILRVVRVNKLRFEFQSWHWWITFGQVIYSLSELCHSLPVYCSLIPKMAPWENWKLKTKMSLMGCLCSVLHPSLVFSRMGHCRETQSCLFKVPANARDSTLTYWILDLRTLNRTAPRADQK